MVHKANKKSQHSLDEYALVELEASGKEKEFIFKFCFGTIVLDTGDLIKVISRTTFHVHSGLFEVSLLLTVRKYSLH